MRMGGPLLLLLLSSVNALLCGCGRHGQISDEGSIASPCVVVSDPSRYSDLDVNLTGYITDTKDGAYIWGDGCKSGVALHFGNALVHDARFREALLQHGMSPSPIKATSVENFDMIDSPV
jgi:hypothetical protein